MGIKFRARSVQLQCGVHLDASNSTVGLLRLGSAEGVGGTWSGWEHCGEGESVVGVRARSMPFAPAKDNSGLQEIGLVCGNKVVSGAGGVSAGAQHNLAFSAGGSSSESRTVEGGWSNTFFCGPGLAVCGLQSRLLDSHAGAKDSMGLTDLRLYCCHIGAGSS